MLDEPFAARQLDGDIERPSGFADSRGEEEVGYPEDDPSANHILAHNFLLRLDRSASRDETADWHRQLKGNSVATLPVGDRFVARLPRPADSVATNLHEAIQGTRGRKGARSVDTTVGAFAPTVVFFSPVCAA